MKNADRGTIFPERISPENRKHSPDYKFIVGMVILGLVLCFMIGSFWDLVARQAQKDLEQEQAQEAYSVTAIALETQGYLKELVFVDTATRQVFQSQTPQEGIYNRTGILIRDDVLEYGDIIRISGEGFSGDDSLPWFEAKKMERVGRASLEVADRFQRIADQALDRREEMP